MVLKPTEKILTLWATPIKMKKKIKMNKFSIKCSRKCRIKKRNKWKKKN